MKPNEIRQKDLTEINKLYIDLLREQFSLRMQKATKRLKQNHLLSRVRSDIARVLTILKEKKAGNAT